MEFVYVVKRSDLFELNYPHGFITGHGDWDGPDRESILERISDRGFFIERRFTEDDSSFKQIIPYCLVKRGQEILLLRRLNTGGEARLHDKLSVGVGGHINPIDEPGGGMLNAGCDREIEEELAIEGSYTKRVIGFINDDASPVGSVHFGVVYVVEPKGECGIRETDMLEGTFTSIDELKSMVASGEHNFETWSSLILARIDDALSS